jgi:predicted lysophospholipase L1 biosynthesis ABC-type transport system permease subunit
MIKTLIKLKILKFILIGGVSAAYAVSRYCDQKNDAKSKKDKKPLLLK